MMTACSLVCKEIFRAINNRCGSYKGTKSGLPKHELEILARHFLPQIQAFFESKEGREEYAAWQQEQALLKAQRAKALCLVCSCTKNRSCYVIL